MPKDEMIESEAAGSKKGFSPDRRRSGRKGSKWGSKFKDRGKNCVPGNDFSYWNKDLEFMKSVTNYPWMHVVGTPLKFSDPSGAGSSIVPGNVLVVSFIPMVGVSANPTDAFNLVVRDTWLAMHRKYRGLGSYQQADLGVTLLCNASVFAQIADAERLYGIIHGYPIKNRITPRGLLAAMGYSTTFIDSLEKNASRFRSSLNRIIKKAKRLCLPKGFSALYNWIGLNSFIYRDAKDNPERAGIIVFQSRGFYVYDAINSTTGGCAVNKPITRSSYTDCMDVLSALEANVDILLGDDDVTRICSDVIACFGDSGLEALSEIPEDYAVNPEYDEATLIKLHNANFYDDNGTHSINTYQLSGVTFTGGITNTNTFTVYQKDNVIISRPTIIGGTSGTSCLSTDSSYTNTVIAQSNSGGHINFNAANEEVIDTWEATPSDATRCEATLWKTVFKSATAKVAGTGADYFYGDVVSCSTEIIVSVHQMDVLRDNVLYNRTMVLGFSGSAPVMNFCHYTQFDWAPVLYACTQSMKGFVPTAVFGDLDNYALISKLTITAIHDATLLSAFKIDLPSGSSMN